MSRLAQLSSCSRGRGLGPSLHLSEAHIGPHWLLGGRGPRLFREGARAGDCQSSLGGWATQCPGT